MGAALVQAAADAGVRLTLLDACYLAGGLGPGGHLPLDPVQRRFSDGTAQGWADRVAALKPTPTVRIGAAIHSVRAVPRTALGQVASAARHTLAPVGAVSAPLHVHLSEQPAENEACLEPLRVHPDRAARRGGGLGAGNHSSPRDTSHRAGHRAAGCIRCERLPVPDDRT